MSNSCRYPFHFDTVSADSLVPVNGNRRWCPLPFPVLALLAVLLDSESGSLGDRACERNELSRPALV